MHDRCLKKAKDIQDIKLDKVKWIEYTVVRKYLFTEALSVFVSTV